jgi:electron transfer flavoprotein alpha subunit
MNTTNRDIWVFGDYRNYFQNRVTLQLLAKAAELAHQTGGRVCAVAFGHKMDEFAGEYIAHGAQIVYVTDHPSLKHYSLDIYADLLTRLAQSLRPEIILIGGTSFGRELAPKVAKRLHTGLSADCIQLGIDAKGRLVQTAPSFGGNLIAQIITPAHRPQMATVRPGTFTELPHDSDAQGEIVITDLPDPLVETRVRTIDIWPISRRGQRLEDARIVICGGRGMGSKLKFKKLYELARLTGGEVGATRPVVYAGWASAESLIGQAGKQVKPKILISFGVSGAIQHTAAISDADFIIAVNKNPNATMMRMADVAIVADANQVCLALIKALKARLRY